MIKLNEVTVRHRPDLIALQATTLEFRRGEFCVLLGASGAGKSTLLRCLNLLNRPSTGRVGTADLGPIDRPAALLEHRRRTGMVFQQHQLIPRRSALDNVLLGRVGYHPTWRTLLPMPRSDQRIALECLDRVGLLDRALDRVDRLSGGQQQRVGIARALAQQPRLMLADEPVASLDPASAHGVLTRLRGIARDDGITTVVSLHQVDLAQAFADRIVGLARGRVVFDGPPGQLSPRVLEMIYGQPVRAGAGAPASPAAAVHPSELALMKD